MSEKITHLSDREHILKRPGMYIGGINSVEIRDFFLENDKFVFTTKAYVPGLIKIIFEAIDNAVDVGIKSNFKYANKIFVDMTDKRVKVSDNGYGISQDIDPETNLSSVVLATGHARAGSNFDENTQRGGVGIYGYGIYLTNVFSKEFICDTFNGKSETKVTFSDNALSYKVDIKTAKSKPGTIIDFEPDLEKFGIENIDDMHMSVVKQRLYILAISYPEIEFRFNGEKISTRYMKQFAAMFGDNYEFAQFENGFIAYYPTNNDEFTFYTVINGHIVPEGGTHIAYINNKVVTYLRDKFAKKYKDIKPSDIRNKLMMITIFRRFPNPDYKGQTKEELTNSYSDIATYLNNVDFEAYAHQVYKNKEISELITEMYRIKEEFQKQKDLERVGKKKGKIKSDKYRDPVGNKDYLLICEGDSALGGLMTELGRKNRGYFAIRGKILNVLEEKSSKISENIEVDSIIKILETEVQRHNLNSSGVYFNMTDTLSGEKYIIHEKDTFKNDNGDWIDFKLLDNERYTTRKIEKQDIDTHDYFAQPRVNQPYNCSYKNIVIATDADFDGGHIRALLLTLFDTLMLPILKAGRICYLNTPVVSLRKNGKVINYFFTLDEYHQFIDKNPNIKGDWKYYKGLGSWSKGELKDIIEKEGFARFLTKFEYDKETHNKLVNWMSAKTADYRKMMIKASQLDISEA